MKFIYNKVFLEHDTGSHPENKKRLIVINAPEVDIKNDESYLSLVHEKEHIELIKRACSKGIQLDSDTLVSKESFKAASYAASASVMAAEKGDFALVRPPGHHAFSNRSGGFCLFNNIAIAAQNLINQGKRVLLVDIDGHHGNGTSYIFYNTDKVLFCSLHQSPAYPGTGESYEIGANKGLGHNVNIPLPPSTSDDLYLDALNRFFPIAKKFNPDVIGISAGFDTHKADPLLDLNLSYNAYHKIGSSFRNNFNCDIFAVLEGGYNIEHLPKCVHNFIAGINNEKIKYAEEGTISASYVKDAYNKRMNQLESKLKDFW